MRNSSLRYSKYLFGLFGVILSLSLILWIGNSVLLRPGIVEAKITQKTIALDKANPNIRAVMAIQGRHTPELMAMPEVVGTAIGLSEAGRPAIMVFTKNVVERGIIPESLEGMPVAVKITGEIVAMKGPPPGKVKKMKEKPTARFVRPVPIGVSTGNEGECSAGTIGARVTDDGENIYVLSNNHVYALENEAPLGSLVLQPGLYDTACMLNEDDSIGTLFDFVPIDFNGGDNTVDAAIALSSIDNLSNSTPPDGYGTPKSVTVTASIDQAVQKYGRTTSLRKGKIAAINATIKITYSAGTAIFVDQIVVSSNKPFLKPGDSGSLLVTDPGCNPVGLLFAGNSTGKYAIANPIDEVLNSFNVTIDGE